MSFSSKHWQIRFFSQSTLFWDVACTALTEQAGPSPRYQAGLRIVPSTRRFGTLDEFCCMTEPELEKEVF